MKCDDILIHVDQYWLMDDNDKLKIEIEAHLCDCDHCSQLFDLGVTIDEHIPSWNEPMMTADGVRIADNVMDRIYQDHTWAIPVQKKSYSFTKPFKRNVAIAIAASVAAMFIVLITFFSKDGHMTSAPVVASESGVIDVVVATSSSSVSSDVLSEHIAVASLSDPFIMEAVTSYSQYYVALAIIGIVGTLLLLNWISRTKQ